MFAVPGWSVSAEALKPETASAKASGGASPAASKSRKRKRNNGPGAESQHVTAANVADLYESVVEGRGVTAEGNVTAKKARPEKGKASAGGEATSAKRMKTEKEENSVTSGSASAKSTHEGQKSKKSKDKNKNKNSGDSSRDHDHDAEDKDRNREKHHGKKKKGANNGGGEKKQEDSTADEEKSDPNQPSGAMSSSSSSSLKPGNVAQSSQPQAAAPKLTPLQASMREKLISARFRHLNETLYTKPSAEAFDLFQESPEMFDEYHDGFRRQVKVWPENPVDSFLGDIRSRAKARPPLKGRPGPSPSQRSKMALPRTAGTCTIADLGCGDARLAASLQKESSKLHLDIKSFDLQSPSPLVTKADIANLPLEDGSVNVAIFCLALMGTNWIDFIEEAYRILHWKGELWIAEIKSRFGPPRKNAVVEHSVGHRKKNNVAPSKKVKAAQAAQVDALHGEDLAVEVDGSEDRRRETDVTAFIEALQKRGFVLQGERAEAVDLSNRMFVKMHFIKGASPTKGKGVQMQGDRMQGQAQKRKRAFAPKRDGDEGEDKDENEASILKPCVYKIR
ncbi:hypothetical protein E4U42_006362 [Claviceps africana]|uniref:Ribosomal RNA-processing protein 8 n=1 Tax=Claviceps africana TaxID=83212 RepID=A0A8K0JBB9_9HYPO|nr:hypothetical protein E4U42_006362 [Claviceps africana]